MLKLHLQESRAASSKVELHEDENREKHLQTDEAIRMVALFLDLQVSIDIQAALWTFPVERHYRVETLVH